jgi:lipopolysaccharide/colanic/teichoic acid biosynthesis glycosyltransferase
VSNQKPHPERKVETAFAADQFGIAVIAAAETHGDNTIVKNLFDAFAAIFGIFAMAIPVLVLHLIIISTLGSPSIFKQTRVGRNGRHFTLYKFRSMTEARTYEGKLLPDKQRTNQVGWFLRRSRLDELPELFNILRGEMSFVGPRPLPPTVIAEFGEWAEIERCKVRPGLTGWAQINGNTQLSNEEKLGLDLWYVHHRGMLIDLKILYKTINVVVCGERRNERVVEEAVRYAKRIGGSC